MREHSTVELQLVSGGETKVETVFVPGKRKNPDPYRNVIIKGPDWRPPSCIGDFHSIFVDPNWVNTILQNEGLQALADYYAALAAAAGGADLNGDGSTADELEWVAASIAAHAAYGPVLVDVLKAGASRRIDGTAIAGMMAGATVASTAVTATVAMGMQRGYF